MNLVSQTFKTILWGNSVGLAWTWGIGLFFSVQMAIQFGFKGLISYATINAVGLSLFGIINHFIAKKYSNAKAYEAAFLQRAHNFKFPFLFYQVVAISLTLFAVLKYVTLPLGVLSLLVCIMFFGATIFLGEEYGIKRIKYSHAVIGLGVAAALYFLYQSELFHNPDLIFSSEKLIKFSNESFYVAFWAPILVGFLCGPWLDLQHWQRAIEIKKEGLSIANSYIIGGLIFWAVIMLDGILALAAFNYGDFREVILATSSNPSSLLFSVKDTITMVLSSSESLKELLSFYIIFVCLAALTTFDSGYVALKWYVKDLIKDSKNLVLSFVPPAFIYSPVPWFVVCIATAMTTLHIAEVGKFISRFDPSLEKFFRFELEYYISFFASFFAMYAVTLYRSTSDSKTIQSFPFLKLFSTGLFSIAIFGIGYFSENAIVMAIGSLMPFIYGFFTYSTNDEIINSDSDQVIDITQSTNKSINQNTDSVQVNANNNANIMPHSGYNLPEGAEPSSVAGCYIKDKWFVHSFIPTYQDTNSVGNVYFAMYAMWVGKTRELFFQHTMPDFDINTTSYYILTRSYEHKFLMETKEFEPVTIHIRVKDYNRKFVTLEHKIFNHKEQMLGKGTQTLMFVSSDDYRLIDIPQEVYGSYLPYTASA